MTNSAAVAEFLIDFAAACELLGYPSWVNRAVLGQHLATTERILDGSSPTAEELRAMVEFADALRELILAQESVRP